MILRVKTHKMCKIGVKTQKPVKSVKPGQTRLKTGKLVKIVKNVTFSWFHFKFKQMHKCSCAVCRPCWLNTLFSQSPPHPWPTLHTVTPHFVPVSLTPFSFSLSSFPFSHQIKKSLSPDLECSWRDDGKNLFPIPSFVFFV